MLQIEGNINEGFCHSDYIARYDKNDKECFLLDSWIVIIGDKDRTKYTYYE